MPTGKAVGSPAPADYPSLSDKKMTFIGFLTRFFSLIFCSRTDYYYLCSGLDDRGGAMKLLFFVPNGVNLMIEKKTVCQIVDEWLEGKDYFLVEVTISPDDKIVVEIDHKEGVWIEDCVELSRYIESRLNREQEDYELEVGSAGIGQPFKVLQQYLCHIGEEVEVLTKDGRKLYGILKEADAEHFVLTVQKKVKEEGAKRPKMVDEDLPFSYDDIKYTKYVISFK